MRPLRSRRTSYRLLFLFFAAAFVYMMFQFFSINMLSLHNRMMQKHERGKYLPAANLQKVKKQQPRVHTNRKEELEQGDNLQRGDNLVDNFGGIVQPNVVNDGIKNPKKLNAQKKVQESAKEKKADSIANVPEKRHVEKGTIHLKKTAEQHLHKKRDFHTFTRTMHGVHPQLLDKYKNTGTTFQCLRTNENIPIDLVNDDYCDCQDGSDEPGTSACQNNKFYCAMQLEGSETLKWIYATFVNDGICDCCDGSDEWQGAQLPSNIRIENPKRKYPVSHAPCKNTCNEAEENAIKLQNMKKMGHRLKQDYIKEAKNHYVTDHKYGSEGEYYKLSQHCFDISHSGFEYSVCPFVKVTQTENKRNTKTLGKSTVTWLNDSEMKMTGGDAVQCPGRIERTSIIKFECGLEDKLLSVRESSVCEYSFVITTPAAC